MVLDLKNRMDETAPSNSKIVRFSEKALFFLTLLLWIDRILLTYIRVVIMALPLIGFMADYLITATYAVLVVFSVPKIVKCMRASDVFFLLSTVIVCLTHYFIFPENASVMEEFMPTFLFSTFPLYFIGLSMNFEKIYPWLYRLSLITVVAFTVYKLYFSAPMTEVQSMYEGDMWSAYNVLPHVCVVALAMLKKPRIINTAVTVIGIIMIASLGSRGPLLCTVLAMAVYLLLFKKYKRPILAYSVIIIAAIIVVVGLESIMQLLYDIAQRAGLSIRIFEKFFEGTITNKSSRDVIAERLYNRIGENPVIGYGLFSDRVAVNTYAHHIAIEMWHAFGVIFGTAILGGIIFVLLRAVKVVRKVDKYALLFIPLLFAGFIKLFMSGSIMEEIYFFLLLGICVRLIRDQKIRNRMC